MSVSNNLVTIRDVARVAKVSTATVSHVINNSRAVAKATRERVLAVMKELSYHPNAVARDLRRQRTETLGLIISDVANPFFPMLVRGVEDTANQHGYNVILCNTDEDAVKESRYLQVLFGRRVDGYLVVPTSGAAGALAALLERKRPLVLIDRLIEGLDTDAVVVDNVQGAYDATTHLLNHGHRKVGVITGPLHLTTARERLDGYARALKEHGLEVEERLVRRSNFKEESGYQCAMDLLRSELRPTALFAANNLLMIGALRAFAEAGVSVPSEVAVVTFDDMPWAPFITPPMTTVAQPAYQMGAAAAQLLLERLHGRRKRPKVLRHPTKLVIRQSCGCS
jgi:LacI family transcriptional regulator